MIERWGWFNAVKRNFRSKIIVVNISPEKKLLDLIRQAQGKMKLNKQLKIFTKVNYILIALVIVILAVILVDVFTTGRQTPNLDVILPDEEVIPVSENFDIDLDDIQMPVRKKVLISKEELVKDFLLMGIIAGDTFQAIIEDKKTKKTNFLYKGDSLRGFTVYEIKDSSVILDYDGEKIELRM